MFTVVNDALVLRDDATVADASAGEIKNVVIDGEGRRPRSGRALRGLSSV